MPDHRIPASEIRRVWLDPNLTTAQAARAVGLARSNLWLRAKALDLPPRKPGNPFAAVEVATFAEMWTAGVSSREIARYFDIHPMTVRSLRDRCGLPPRPAGGHKDVVTLIDFDQMRLARAMAATAALEAAAFQERNMIDLIRVRGAR